MNAQNISSLLDSEEDVLSSPLLTCRWVLFEVFLNNVENLEKPSAVVSLLSQFDQRETMGCFLKEHKVKLRHKLHYYLRMQVTTQYWSNW